MIEIDRILNFSLPPHLEATTPPEARGLNRDEVRLLVSSQRDDSIRHVHFSDLPDFLEPGDLIVANDSPTLPAALDACRTDETGRSEPFALHLSTQLSRDIWVAEPRKVAVAAGDTLILPDGGMAKLLAPYAASGRLWMARLALPQPVLAYLRRWGRPITYSYVQGSWPLEMYQNVYARSTRDGRGSAEMPSAGSPFSKRVLQRLGERGIGFVTLTLHTGVSSLESHEAPYPEPFRVPARTAEAVNATRVNGRRVIAVGTTVVRALESAVDTHAHVRAVSDWTELVITPERGVRVVDGLLTGFHEPQATHLAMLEALSNREHLEAVYRAALAEGYLWHEFGDVHLLLR
ncbi:MAG TPA: S-adenosylmethionine:tRNA ribosyltransferase-isomerase [Ktedonobacterales bacterium]